MTPATEELQALLDAAPPRPWRVESGADGYRFTMRLDGANHKTMAWVNGDGDLEDFALSLPPETQLLRMSPDLAAEVIRLREELRRVASMVGDASDAIAQGKIDPAKLLIGLAYNRARAALEGK